MAFPQTPLAITVELFISGGWVDITSDVRGLDGLTGIDIVRSAYRIGQGSVQHGTCDLTLEDPTGKYTDANPMSIYYGLIGQNTQLRVKVDSDVRCVMEVPEWVPVADPTGTDVTVPIQARGILSRLSQGAKLKHSIAYRSIMAAENDATRVAYWPVEEESDATLITSPVGSPNIGYAGDIDFGAYTDGPSSERMLTFGTGGLLFATVPDYAVGESKVISLWTFPEAGTLLDNSVILRLYASGTISIWDLVYGTASGGTLSLRGYSGGALVDTLGPVAFAVDGDHGLISVELAQDGADIDLRLLYVTADGSATISDDTFVGQTLGRVTHITIGQTDIAGTSFGHLAVGTDTAAAFENFLTPDPISGARGTGAYSGETAAGRMARLCDEAGIAFTLVGNAADTALMGPQQADTFVALVQAATDADGGLLYETRTELGLSYRTRVSLYNQAETLALDYEAFHLSDPFQPTNDDQLIENDVTVSRINGSSARAVLETNYLNHRRSTAAPPDGVGTYDRGGHTLNVESDDQLNDIAYWMRHLGTWSEYRYPVAVLELARSVWAGDAALTADAVDADMGDAFTVDNLPVWLPPDLVQLQVIGEKESLAQYRRDLEFSLVPGWPWEVWQLDTGGSSLTKASAAGGTTWKLDTSSGPAWSTTAEPYHLQCDGEAATCTAMVTDTATFVATGVVAHGNNASVAPALPAGLAEGDLLLVFAAIRNSGTGTVDTPTGYTILVDGSNMRLFAKYASAAEVAPTVSFTGGAANADTSAQTAAFRGCSLRSDTRGDGSTTQLNSSAQDVAYPALTVLRDGCVILYLGWKQDDWTSVATIASATEIGEPDTTTGDDQGLVWDYVIQTVAANIPAGSFVVTGGGAAISRGAVIALRPTQTATVTRAVNGVAKALTVGKAVNGWRMGVVAL